MVKHARQVKPGRWQLGGKRRDPSPHAIAAAAQRARQDLAQYSGLQSSKFPAGRVQVALMLLTLVATILGAIGYGNFEIVWTCVSGVFVAFGLIRFVAALSPPPNDSAVETGAMPQAAPVWTILIALYKEADCVPSLLCALAQLQWAKDRLDIIFACECDDDATLEVLVAHQSKYLFRIVRVPAGGPRTKPHALQTALPFARGRFVTVYDAEDRPSREQLRAAFQAFLNGPANLAVVQAPLVIWNDRESWIAHQFALDYAIWFRVMLPAFVKLSGLIPLGGTSNHFRTEYLRKVGGWDPYNVTEDADLGVRLARHGYCAQLISPPTFEEAPPKISAWVIQRGRWIQGHIQTFSLHLRTPLALSKDIGWRGVLAFCIGLGIGPMSALIMLPFTIGLILATINGAGSVAWLPFGAGMLGHVLVSAIACRRDGRMGLLIGVMTLPIYHCLQSIAACRAMWRVVFTPAIWDKTDHGCAARAPKCKVKCEGDQAWIGQQRLPFLALARRFSPLPRGAPPALPNLEKSV